MDLWVVAAAAGAGYVAKYWQQFSSKEEEGSASSEPVSGDSDSRKLFQKFRDQALPLPRLGQKQLGKKDVWDGYNNNRSGYGDEYGHDGTGIASTSGDVVEGNVLSLMNLSTGVCGSESFRGFGYGDKRKSDFSVGETNSIRISKHRNFRDRSNGYFVKPLENPLEQYVYSSVASPSLSGVRPLVVTNGRRVISRASSEVRRDSGEFRSRMGSIELPRRSKVSFAKQRRSSRFSISSTRMSEGAQHPSQGSSNGMLLFFLGITIGIMSTVVANQKQLDKLNELLKKSESLVQDLQEELEMKEFSTVKELDIKDIENPTIDEHPNEQDPDKPTNYDDKETNGTEKANLMNSIEAELEAELQKLELSMETSRLERISKLAELDPGFVADIAEGEFETDRDVSETSTTELDPPNYSVPPMELSLRLHELIRSRLEARISELEAALENSEQRGHSMAYSESDRSLSTQGSPVFRDEPMVMNLSGEALDAYNEAYEEMYRILDEDPESEMSGDLFVDKLGAVEEEKTSRSLSFNGLRESEEEEEEEEDDDEMEKLLIKQIVERTKGSDAVLRVQKILNRLKDQ